MLYERQLCCSCCYSHFTALSKKKIIASCRPTSPYCDSHYHYVHTHTHTYTQTRMCLKSVDRTGVWAQRLSSGFFFPTASYYSNKISNSNNNNICRQHFPRLISLVHSLLRFVTDAVRLCFVFRPNAENKTLLLLL